MIEAPSLSGPADSAFAPPGRLLLVDDHPFVRDGIAGLFRGSDEFEVVGEAASGAEAIEKIRELRPELVIVDLRLPDMEGTKILDAVRAVRWQTSAVVLSAFQSDDDLLTAARAGAMGYLLKTETSVRVLDVLRRVRGGENVLERELPSSLRARLRQKGLTGKELAVLRLVGRGLTNKEICRYTKLSENTVKTHLRRIFDKLGVSNRAEAATMALRRGLAGVILPLLAGGTGSSAPVGFL